jgi:hypothetical protein
MIDVEDTAPESADPLLLNSALQTEDSLTFEEWKIGENIYYLTAIIDARRHERKFLYVNGTIVITANS